MSRHLKPEFADPAKRHIDADCSDLKGTHRNELFYNCTFKDLNGLDLIDCDLNQSKFVTDKLEDMLNFSVTLNCMSFGGVELSELIFDTILILLMKTKGNTQKRQALINVVGRERAKELLAAMSRLERK